MYMANAIQTKYESLLLASIIDREYNLLEDNTMNHYQKNSSKAHHDVLQ